MSTDPLEVWVENMESLEIKNKKKTAAPYSSSADDTINTGLEPFNRPALVVKPRSDRARTWTGQLGQVSIYRFWTPPPQTSCHETSPSAGEAGSAKPVVGSSIHWQKYRDGSRRLAIGLPLGWWNSSRQLSHKHTHHLKKGRISVSLCPIQKTQKHSFLRPNQT
jgi:hypothetical protein